MSQLTATSLGIISIILWGFSPLCGVRLTQLPIFFLISFTATLSFCLTCLSLSLRGGWRQIRIHPTKCLLASLLLFLNQTTYYGAFRHLSPELCELLYYTWPIILALSLPQSDKRWIPRCATALIGFAGIAVLNVEGINALFSKDFNNTGLLFIIIAVVTWSLYVKRSQQGSKQAGEIIGIYNGVVAAISLSVHLLYEGSAIPTPTEFFYLLLMGLGPVGAAYIFWETGVRYGRLHLLSVLVFFVPILSISILVFSGDTLPTERLFIATVLITLAAFMAQKISDSASAEHRHQTT